MVDLENPLSSEQLDEISAAITSSDQAKQLITRIENAGFDMSEQKKSLTEQTQKLKQIRAAFRPQG